MAEKNFGIILAFVIYFSAMLGIGFWYWKKSQSIADYMLGGRGLNAWVAAMSAVASDMSGWLLMGLPGFAYIAGLNAYWIAIGLALGTWANWQIVAKRLRNYTIVAKDSITLPIFFENRFRDQSKVLRIVSAVFIFIFFLIYTSSGFVAGGKLFNTVFGVSYLPSLFITAGVVVVYTFLGGFTAVCWTDFCQGTLMFFAILAVPLMAMHELGGPVVTLRAIELNNPELLNLFTNPDGTTVTFVAVVSMLAWGLGYFGQPHILVRFMAIRSSKEIVSATRIAVVWVFFSLGAAVLIGMVGKVYLGDVLNGGQSEAVFMVLSEKLFSSFPAGVILSAVLAAIMSTASSQLLVTSSAVSQDFYQAIFRPNASEKELVMVSRIMVVVVALLAITLATDPESSVLNLVAYAWAGFGAAFGPLVLMSLFWKRTTLRGAVAGILAGGITVLLWQKFGYKPLYEIVPGFFASLLTIYLVSIFDTPPSEEIQTEFDLFISENAKK